jgi:hypothetical protein
MSRKSTLLLAILVLVCLGCAGSRYETVTVSPRIDLAQHETIGVIDFSTASRGELGPLTTRRFTELARQDQGLVRMLSFGSEKKALRSVGERRLNTKAFRALGARHGVQTIVTGELTVSGVKPDLALHGLSAGSVTGKVDATLAVEMIETETGASLWNSSARATRSVGQVSVHDGGVFVFDAEDPEGAYGELVDSLVTQVTRDFRVSYERRRVE